MLQTSQGGYDMADDKPEHAEKPTGLDLLRVPFPASQIAKLPKPTPQQTSKLKAAMDKKDFSLGIRCDLCGQWHHKDAIHLDYVGHAALTGRLLDADPSWNWEPVATNENGTPAFDSIGGMWIRLTVCGVTRLGYGDATGKNGANAIKEVIGDALRNAAMRFGAALDLWHKGDLHADDGEQEKASKPAERDTGPNPVQIAMKSLRNAETLEALVEIWKGKNFPRAAPGVAEAKEARKAELQPPADDLAGDNVPY